MPSNLGRDTPTPPEDTNLPLSYFISPLSKYRFHLPIPKFISEGVGQIELQVEDQLESKFRVNLKDSILNAVGKINCWRLANVPIVNYFILVVFTYLLGKLTTRYHKLYTKSSVLATIAANVVLYGIADTLAQSIPGWVSARRYRIWRKVECEVETANLEEGILSDQYRDNACHNNGETIDGISSSAIAETFADYGDAIPLAPIPNSGNAKPGGDVVWFNGRRFIGFVIWGFIMAFIQVVWYLFLNSMFKDMPTIVSVLERILVDQLCFSPVSLACFFAYSTMVIEQGTKKDYQKKLFNLYFSTLAVSFSVWFPVQFINFSVMPRNLQVPFSSGVGVIWNCFLSFRNASSK